MQIYQCNDDGSNGHWIKVDMVRTVSGIEKYKGQDGYIALGEGITNTVYIGLEEVKTTSTFYKAGTTTKVSLKSNVTLKDIDSHQYIGVKASKVDGQYVSSNTKLSYTEDNGTNIYYANYDDDYDSQDFTCAAFIFEGNSFEYTFGRNLDQPTRRDQFVGSGQNMIKFNTVPPTKSVTDNNETKVTSNTVEHFGQDWTYNVEQVIPTGIPTAHRYTKFEFEDEIESCMKINSVKVIASNMEKEKDETSLFDIQTTGNKVTAKLKDAKGSADFYKYGIHTLKINVSLNIPANATQEQMAALKKQWKEHGHYDETKNVKITAGVGVAGIAIIAILSKVKPALFDNGLSKIIDWFSVLDRFNDFCSGILNASSIIYYVSFIAVFLFLTMQGIEKRRWN